jgi:hypothetical protein
MNSELRVVTQWPLCEGLLPADRPIRHLDHSHVQRLLREESVRFVLADCGLPLQWIPESERFAFWKSVRAQIAEPDKAIYLGGFPQNVAYVASQWQGHGGKCVVLLEKHP